MASAPGRRLGDVVAQGRGLGSRRPRRATAEDSVSGMLAHGLGLDLYPVDEQGILWISPLNL